MSEPSHGNAGELPYTIWRRGGQHYTFVTVGPAAPEWIDPIDVVPASQLDQVREERDHWQRQVGALTSRELREKARANKLQVRVEELEEQQDLTCRQRDDLKRCGTEWQKRAGVAEQSLDGAREALKFYAEQKGLGSVLASDGGMKARTALATSSPNGEEPAEDCDDLCKCSHVRHEHNYYPDPEAGPETGKCAHCGCERFEEACPACDGDGPLEGQREHFAEFAGVMRAGGFDRLAARIDQILEGEHGSTSPPNGEEPRYIVRQQDDPEPAEHPKGGDASQGWEVVDTTDDTIYSDWFTEADALAEAARRNSQPAPEVSQDCGGEAASVDLGEVEIDRAYIDEQTGKHLRVIWREVDGEKRRATSFVPIDRDTFTPDFLAALDQARPRHTVYLYNEAERMVNASKPEPNHDPVGGEEG